MAKIVLGIPSKCATLHRLGISREDLNLGTRSGPLFFEQLEQLACAWLFGNLNACARTFAVYKGVPIFAQDRSPSIEVSVCVGKSAHRSLQNSVRRNVFTERGAGPSRLVRVPGPPLC